jgi:hypothetical protein
VLRFLTTNPPLNAPRGMPPASGRPIRVEFRPALTARGGVLLSRQNAGMPVHAATFIRQRRIVLDSGLKSRRGELERILLHEVFHFVWLRLGNSKRRSYEELIAKELRRRAPGELGWSAELRKQKLHVRDREARTRRWREYCCESFCDTGAWLLAGRSRHAEFTLPRFHRAARRHWFGGQGILREISI